MHTLIHMYVRTCTHVHPRIYKHTHKPTQTYTNIHTRACTHRGKPLASFICAGNPQLTVIVRGPSGTHVWAMEMKHKLDSDPVCVISPAAQHSSPLPLLPTTSTQPLLAPPTYLCMYL